MDHTREHHLRQLHGGGCMNISIPARRGAVFRGGGLYKKPILGSLMECFGTDTFTYREACSRISGFSRAVCWDLLDAGLIEAVTTTHPFLYRVHVARPTHKLTEREKILRTRSKYQNTGAAA